MVRNDVFKLSLARAEIFHNAFQLSSSSKFSQSIVTRLELHFFRLAPSLFRMCYFIDELYIFLGEAAVNDGAIISKLNYYNCNNRYSTFNDLLDTNLMTAALTSKVIFCDDLGLSE